jgi:hypothetical protein
VLGLYPGESGGGGGACLTNANGQSSGRGGDGGFPGGSGGSSGAVSSPTFTGICARSGNGANGVVVVDTLG